MKEMLKMLFESVTERRFVEQRLMLNGRRLVVVPTVQVLLLQDSAMKRVINVVSVAILLETVGVERIAIITRPIQGAHEEVVAEVEVLDAKEVGTGVLCASQSVDIEAGVEVEARVQKLQGTRKNENVALPKLKISLSRYYHCLVWSTVIVWSRLVLFSSICN